MKTTRAKKEQGVKLGRPKGTRKSKLDKFKPDKMILRHSSFSKRRVI
jgi:hypothetical protein